MFLDIFKGDSLELQGYLKEVQRVFQGNFKAVSKTFKEVSRVFKGRLKSVSMELYVGFKGV